MNKKFFLIPLASMALSLSAQAESPISLIRKNVPIAKKEMRRYKVPASICLAQFCEESTFGKSHVARVANNVYGMKGHYINHVPCKTYRGYKVYPSVTVSFDDHAETLSGYARLRKLSPTDYKGWAKGIARSGYAEDPAYAQKLIAYIEKYKLYKYDAQVVHNM